MNNINKIDDSRIEDLEDIIKILVSMLEKNNVSKEIIKLELRIYHYCSDCMNHYRGCKCNENHSENHSDNSSINDNYTSSSCSYDSD
jgi:hypothetical protein